MSDNAFLEIDYMLECRYILAIRTLAVYGASLRLKRQIRKVMFGLSLLHHYQEKQGAPIQSMQLILEEMNRLEGRGNHKYGYEGLRPQSTKIKSN